MVPCDFIYGGQPAPTLLLTHEQGLVPVGVVTLCHSLTVKSIPTDLCESKFLCKVIADRVSIIKCPYRLSDVCVWNFYKIFSHNKRGIINLYTNDSMRVTDLSTTKPPRNVKSLLSVVHLQG